MNRLNGSHEAISKLDRHRYICDLLFLDGPLLCLYRDDRSDWLYLWADTDGERRERWLLFPVSRKALVDYLAKRRTLRNLVLSASEIHCLDIRAATPGEDGKVKPEHRYLRLVSADGLPQTYIPAARSRYDEELGPDIELARGFRPSRFAVRITGEWFGASFNEFFNVYGQIYAFLYCTTPQFVTNLGARVARYLRAPWRGGFSRVNLFGAFERLVPSVHDLRVAKISYASPGYVRFEAVQSVGQQIAVTLSKYEMAAASLIEVERKLGTLMSSHKLTKLNGSRLTDATLPLTEEQKDFLSEAIVYVGATLGVAEAIRDLREHSPNVLVAAKAVVALLSRIRRLREFEQEGLVAMTTIKETSDART